MSLITIKGSRAIERAFRELPRKIATKLVRRSLREGAKIVQAQAKADAPVDTGLLEKSIKVVSGRSRKKGVFLMGVLIGSGNFKGETFYGAFQEFGWKTGKRGSVHRRKIPGKRFLKRAMRGMRDEAQRVILETIADGIDRVVAGGHWAPPKTKKSS